ncbi:hypothetical protein C7C46_31015 [Streptomyces tateyamensis]|uniref:Uncharacterized protein n=1 Tax=Streptomyces tateyamensis TaxID=565073 RepID=A0A2V4MT82_9ACTN|nr:hypothetical protein C7C46_31015 [Streptomyces tateyamensis]
MPQPGLGPFLKSLKATRTDVSGAAATAEWGSAWREFGVDWAFDAALRYDVYRFGPGQGPEPAGVVVVDGRQPSAVV